MDPSDYQRIRLWAGITSIGTNLALIWGLALSATWWAAGFSGPLVTSAVLLAVALFITLANLPFDLLVGYAVENAAGRIGKPMSTWLDDWIRNRSLTLVGLWTGMLYFSVFYQIPRHWTALPYSAAAALIFLLFLLTPAGHSAAPDSSEEAFEKNLEMEMKSLGVKLRPVRWFDHGDLKTVNGCITPLGFLSLSSTVTRWLTPREAALMSAREEYYRRSRVWILILGIVTGWTLLGILLASLLPSVNSVQAGLHGAAVMSSWCFLALFIWPTINRLWMKKADRFLASLTVPQEVCDLLSKVERLNATDISLFPVKTVVFHPIPPLQQRLDRLV